MGRISREQLLAIRPKTKEIDVPDWGGSILIQELTLAQREAIEKPRSNTDAGIKVLLEGVVEPKFELADYERLKHMGGASLELVLSEILTLSGMTQPEQDRIVKA